VLDGRSAAYPQAATIPTRTKPEVTKMICEVCGNLLEDCECDWQDNECCDEPLSNDIGETDYDGDGI
jgi:hypothetical protein